jgi:hypothetical protein
MAAAPGPAPLRQRQNPPVADRSRRPTWCLA